MSIAWVLAKPFIAATLDRSRNIRELEDNIKTVETSISPENVVQIDAMSKPVLDKLGYNPDYY